MLQRRIVSFQGHVQGVGFRYTVSRIAGGFEVTGYVRNCTDGSVEMVAEGGSRELNAFIAEIRSTMSHFIRNVNMQKAPADGTFSGFSIRHG
ncbi:MAG: acylphosphatase [Planctomycetes bacterium]|nr:acylphosphatase [Planctomycetota bacterium]